MGRPKGSKNKPKTKTKTQETLEHVRELPPLTTGILAVPAEPPAYVPLTAITAEAKAELAKQVRAECEALMPKYGLQAWPDEIMMPRMAAILNAVDAETAGKAVKRALDRMQTHLWALWAAGRISGPVNKLNVEVKAKKAESLARYLESIGQDEQAAKQWERAEKIRNSVEGANEDVN